MLLSQVIDISGLGNHINLEKTKIVRHSDYQIIHEDLIEEYQKYQPNNVFGNCDYIVVFTALEKRLSLFYGVYRINGGEFRKSVNIPQELVECGYDKQTGCFLYDIEKLDYLSNLKDRLVIDWGEGLRSWHQWLNKNDKKVVEIRPPIRP
ncbi:MAG TPA: hypothetical protein EYO61_04870 [Campylobacterales bacterium]|nr:hypothetical protein [Campylobacterales bacterium]